MEVKPDARRKYPRVKAPKELHVAWKSSGHQAVSRAETIALGGLFLYTRKPPAAGAVVELIIDFVGGSIRARAIVRHSTPGKGMGVQFVQMAPENRARLNQLLVKYAANAPADWKRETPVDATPAVPSGHEPAGQIDFEAELAQLLATAKKGNHYQLLGVTSDSPVNQIKQRFYALARKFHPDHHMGRKESLASLKELMGMLTTAYKTLLDDEKRGLYDRQLEHSGAFDLHRNKTQSQTIIEDSLARARECLRADNFVGSIVWLRKCVEMAPDDAAYHTMLARSLGKVVQYQHKAIAHFRKAIELDPWKLDSYLQLAELYEEMELPSQALSIYSRILNIDPVHAKARERHSKMSSTPVASPH
jgi:curved DNA-binding protein CbpA